MPSNASIAWERVGDVLLVVHAPRTPSDAEWDEVMNSSAGRGPLGGVVVVTNGVRPGPRQRAQFQERLDGARVAVLTDSVVSRGAVTALRWFGVQIRAFSTSQIEQALVFGGVQEVDMAGARRMLDEMSRKVLAA